MPRRIERKRNSKTRKRRTNEKTILEAALEYCSFSWCVIPIYAHGKEPLVPWKGYQSGHATVKQVRAWWTGWPDANVGIVTGAISNLVVLDVDGPTGEATLARLIEEYGSLPKTPESRTGHGRHLYFKHPGTPVRTTAGKLGEGLDVRGDGGYVIAPPSVHESGARYQWTAAFAQKKLADLPDWLVKLLASSLSARNENSEDSTIYEGQRNETLTKLGGAMRRHGADETTIIDTLRQENQRRCEPPLSDDEVRTIAGSVGSYAPATDSEPHSDVGNARRFVAQYGKDLRYCGEIGKWLIWDGTRWLNDERDTVTAWAKQTVRALYLEAASATDRDAKALGEHALRSQSAGRIGSMVSLAKSEEGIPVLANELDKDAWLLNVNNGTLDLRTGQLRPHCRTDLITKLAPVPYEPTAQCPTWEKFLGRILKDNHQLIEFLQRAIGYSLTGSTREQCLFILYGGGSNGKSTFIRTIEALVGQYATPTSTETLLVKKGGGGIPNDVANLHGARFVSAVEAEAQRTLAESLIKRLTGEDTISARYLYKEYFSFVPTFKIWLATNHKPTIRGTDRAIWRRIRLIPFEVTIPKQEQDKDLGSKLERELSGILQWAVKGCLAWQQQGLKPPSVVHEATRAYQKEMDVLSQFLNECCQLVGGAVVSKRELYEAYVRWCQDNGEPYLSMRKMNTLLTERGLKEDRSATVRQWGGIELLSQGEERQTR